MDTQCARPLDDGKLAAALDHARRGFAVFPLVPNSKVPAIENWQNRATNDQQQIQAWAEQIPDANWGIHTGTLLVVDVDPRNGGDESFAALEMTEELPATAISRTQGGGQHHFYALPPHTVVRGGKDRLGRGVDVKSYGGYVVAPGSTIDGRPYAWLGDTPRMTEAPQWLVERCRQPATRTRAAGQRIIEEDETALDLAEQYLATFAPEAVEGERDDTAFRVAARLYDFGISRDTAQALLAEWNEQNCHPPLDNDDIERLAYSAQRNRGNAIGSKHPSAPGFDTYEMPVDSRPPQPAEQAKPRSKFYAVRADEGARRALENPGEPLIKGVIHRHAMSVLIGAPNAGKTFLVLDMCYHIATGKPWANRQVRQGAVVYLAAEAGNMIMTRLAALEAHYGQLGDTPLYVVPCSADFAHGTEDAAAILALIRDIEATSGHKVEMFVVDTLNRAIAGGDENSSKDVGALIRCVDLIREHAKTHALIIHHPGKDETKGGRGHSSVLGGTDTEMLVTKGELAFTKQRDMPLGDPIRFKLRPVVVGVDPDGVAVTSCYVEMREPGEPEEQVALTSLQQDIIEEIDEALTNADKKSFDWKFAQRCIGAVSDRSGPETTTDTQTDTLPKRTTVLHHLSVLSEKGWIAKSGPGQWVRRVSVSVS